MNREGSQAYRPTPAPSEIRYATKYAMTAFPTQPTARASGTRQTGVHGPPAPPLPEGEPLGAAAVVMKCCCDDPSLGPRPLQDPGPAIQQHGTQAPEGIAARVQPPHARRATRCAPMNADPISTDPLGQTPFCMFNLSVPNRKRLKQPATDRPDKRRHRVDHPMSAPRSSPSQCPSVVRTRVAVQSRAHSVWSGAVSRPRVQRLVCQGRGTREPLALAETWGLIMTLCGSPLSFVMISTT